MCVLQNRQGLLTSVTDRLKVIDAKADLSRRTNSRPMAHAGSHTTGFLSNVAESIKTRENGSPTSERQIQISFSFDRAYMYLAPAGVNSPLP
jgi:hypothetical protein